MLCHLFSLNLNLSTLYYCALLYAVWVSKNKGLYTSYFEWNWTSMGSIYKQGYFRGVKCDISQEIWNAKFWSWGCCEVSWGAPSTLKYERRNSNKRKQNYYMKIINITPPWNVLKNWWHGARLENHPRSWKGLLYLDLIN